MHAYVSLENVEIYFYIDMRAVTLEHGCEFGYKSAVVEIFLSTTRRLWTVGRKVRLQLTATAATGLVTRHLLSRPNARTHPLREHD